MPDYEALYFKMFGAISDAVDILQRAQVEAEELYIELGEKAIKKFKNRSVELQVIDTKEIKQ